MSFEKSDEHYYKLLFETFYNNKCNEDDKYEVIHKLVAIFKSECDAIFNSFLNEFKGKCERNEGFIVRYNGVEFKYKAKCIAHLAKRYEFVSFCDYDTRVNNKILFFKTCCEPEWYDFLMLFAKSLPVKCIKHLISIGMMMEL